MLSESAPRIGRRIADQQAAAALGHALHHAAAVADAHRAAVRRVHGAVLRHRHELGRSRLGEQQHAALGVELLDHHLHRALRQLAQIGERVEEPAHRLDQLALAAPGRRAGAGAAQPLHRQSSSARSRPRRSPSRSNAAGRLLEPLADRRVAPVRLAAPGARTRAPRSGAIGRRRQRQRDAAERLLGVDRVPRQVGPATSASSARELPGERRRVRSRADPSSHSSAARRAVRSPSRRSPRRSAGASGAAQQQDRARDRAAGAARPSSARSQSSAASVQRAARREHAAVLDAAPVDLVRQSARHRQLERAARRALGAARPAGDALRLGAARAMRRPRAAAHGRG